MDRRAAQRDQTRAEIVAAAWQLAARDGVAAISLRDLAAKVGMRAPSLYTYFASKDAIYDAMFADGWRQLGDHMGDVETIEDPEQRLREGVRRFLAFCAADLARYQLLLTHAVPGWRPSAQAYAVSVAHQERMVRGLAPLGLDQPQLLDLFMSLTAGLAAQHAANDPGGDRYLRLADRAIDMFLLYLKETT